MNVRGVLVSAVMATTLLSGSTGQPALAQDPAFPHLTPVEMRDLGNQAPLPRTAPVTAPPAITGHAGADARIQQAAFARGYRLRSVPTGPLTSVDGVLVQPETADAWRALQADAAAHGHRLVAQSGFRSIGDQQGIFRRKLAGASNADLASGRADGRIEAALRQNSIPGTSKHHTGHTVDIRVVGGTIGGFSATPAYRWLSADNFAAAKRHGFLPSYPAGAGLQGPDPEPWELAWIGTATIRCAANRIALTTPAPEGRCPIGHLDAAVDDGDAVVASGWALDRDAAGPIAVHLYVDGRPAHVGTADQHRPDVAAAMGTDPARGFSVRLALGPGAHSVCAYGINDRPGAVNSLLGCRDVTVRDTAPVGALDAVVRDGGTVFVAGWAADPDIDTPAPVHIYVDGVGAAILTADRSRPDVAAATGLGEQRGFAARFPVDAGVSQVCAYALGDRPGVSSLLGCRTLR